MLEAFFEFILEFIAEILIQAGIEIGLDFGLGSIAESLKGERRSNPFLSHVGLFVLGTLTGVVSVLIFPHRMIKRGIPGVGLFLAPICIGLVLQIFGDYRRGNGKTTSYLATFWGGAVFAFAYALVRWYFLHDF